MIVLWRLREDILTSDAHSPWANEFAVVIGILATVITAILYGIFSRDRFRPERANPWQYGELSARRDYLESGFNAYCQGTAATPAFQAACAEARAHLDHMALVLGPSHSQKSDAGGSLSVAEDPGQLLSADKWILGTGFVELWQRLHATEAALFSQRPLAQRLSYGRQDVLRLSGCELATGGTLKLRLEEAILTLEKIPDDSNGARTPAEKRATEILISVHKTIDDYRDQSRAGLARTRVHLIWAGVMTAAVAYILLALAILDDVEPYQIIGGAAFFLVGAVTGLIWQLRRSNIELRSGEDDFGLDLARLIYVPVLSGLAGVGGVLLMSMLYPSLNFALAVPVDPNTTTPVEIPPVDAIFDLNKNRFGLVMAAVFGLTPDLLINRLQGLADKYQTQLAATSPQTRSSEPVDTGVIDQLRVLVTEMTGQGTTGQNGWTGQGTTGVNGWTGQAGWTGGNTGNPIFGEGAPDTAPAGPGGAPPGTGGVG